MHMHDGIFSHTCSPNNMILILDFSNSQQHTDSFTTSYTFQKGSEKMQGKYTGIYCNYMQTFEIKVVQLGKRFLRVLCVLLSMVAVRGRERAKKWQEARGTQKR